MGKFKKMIHKLAAIITIVSMAGAAIPAHSITAAEPKYTRYAEGAYKGYDGENYGFTGNMKVLKYKSNGSVVIDDWGNMTGKGDKRKKYNITDGKNIYSVYCMEVAVGFHSGEDIAKGSLERLSWLPTNSQEGIKLALLFGYHDGMKTPVTGTNNDDFEFATQVIIWEYEQQLRTSPTKRLSSNSYGISGNTYYNMLKNRPAEKCYNYILSEMSKYSKIPSFLSKTSAGQKTYKMTYNSNGTYSVTLTDTNKTGVDLVFDKNNSNFSVTKNGYSYTFTSKTNSDYNISAKKKISTTNRPLAIWSSPGSQTMIDGADNSLKMYARFTTPVSGNFQILKSSEDGVISGMKFQITGNNINKTLTTDINGIISGSLPEGTYTIKEVNTPSRYNSLASKTVTLKNNTVTVLEFINTLKSGTVSVKKTSEDNKIEGVWFHMFGTALNGKEVSRYAQTNALGIANFENVPVSDSTGYTIEEYNISTIYNNPGTKNVKVTANSTQQVSFNNTLAKGKVKIIKTSEDNNVEGFTFKLTGVSASGQTINMTKTTDASGIAIFDNVPISGKNAYQILENLTPNQANVYRTPNAITVQVIKDTESEVEVKNKLLPARIKITKTSNTGKVSDFWFKLEGKNHKNETVVKYAATNNIGIADFGDIDISDSNGYKITEYFAPSSTVEFTSVSKGTIAADKQSVIVNATTPGEYAVAANNTITTITENKYNLLVYKDAQDGNIEGVNFLAFIFPNETTYNDFLATGDTTTAAKQKIFKTDANGIAKIEGDIIKYASGYSDPLLAGQEIDPSVNDAYLVVTEVTTAYIDQFIEQLKAQGKTEAEAREYLTNLGFNLDYPYDKYDSFVVYGGEVTDKKVVTAKLSKNGTYAAHFTNQLKTTNVKLVKTSEDNNIENITFNLICNTTKETFTGITNAQGEIIFSNIPLGNYTLEEINPNKTIYNDLTTFTVDDVSSTTYNISDTFNITNTTTQINANNTIKYNPEFGHLRIVKDSEDGIINDVSFRIVGTADNGTSVDETVTTNDSGVAEIELPTGTYTVNEINVASRYIAPDPITVTIVKSSNIDGESELGDSTIIEFTTIFFYNELTKGSVKVIKTSEDNIISGVEFHLFGISDIGTDVSLYEFTDDNGYAYFKDLLPGSYEIEEVNIPNRYSNPGTKSVTVDDTTEKEVEFHNELIPEIPESYIYKEMYYIETLGDNADLIINGKNYKLHEVNEHDISLNDNVIVTNKENLDEYVDYIHVKDGSYKEYIYKDTIKDNSTVLYQFYDLPTYDVNYWLQVKDENESETTVDGKYFVQSKKDSILNTKVYPGTTIIYNEENDIVGVSEIVDTNVNNPGNTYKTFKGYKYSDSATKSEDNPNQGGVVVKDDETIIDLYYIFESEEEPPIKEPPEIETGDTSSNKSKFFAMLAVASGLLFVLTYKVKEDEPDIKNYLE